MPTSFSLDVDTVPVPAAEPLRRSVTAPFDELPGRGRALEACGARDDAYSGLCDANGQPYDYPAPVYVRNTFVVLVPGRDPSLDEFFEERRIHSCPANWGPSKEEEGPVRECSTACGSAPSESSAAASTPPMLHSPGDSDAEMDLSELARCETAATCAATIPPSRTRFRRSVTEYRANEESQAADSRADALQRHALPPGPVQGASVPCAVPVYYSDTPQGYGVCYDTAYPCPPVDSNCGGFAGNFIPAFQSSHPTGSAQCNIVTLPPSGEHGGQVSHAPGEQSPSMQTFHMRQQVSEDNPPTRGSIGHGSGRCKPCAFVHTKGCGNGFECPFCHLCEPGEKKKRRKDKIEARRATRDIRQAFSLLGGSSLIGHGGSFHRN